MGVVDLLVDLPSESGLFSLLALQGSLGRLLEVDVDRATRADLEQQVRAGALEDAIAL